MIHLKCGGKTLAVCDGMMEVSGIVANAKFLENTFFLGSR
jgi:hypothetical protein